MVSNDPTMMAVAEFAFAVENFITSSSLRFRIHTMLGRTDVNISIPIMRSAIARDTESYDLSLGMWKVDTCLKLGQVIGFTLH